MKTPWQILGKTTEPIEVKREPFKEGDNEICIQFPNEGCITIEFYWSSDIVKGQKSVNPRITPDDPDMLICTSFFVKSIFVYDVMGSETRIKPTGELSHLFLNWVKDHDLINVDEYDV